MARFWGRASSREWRSQVHTLIVGGAGYLLSAFLSNGLVDAPPWVEGLTLPASVGELWTIGYLLFVGIRPAAV